MTDDIELVPVEGNPFSVQAYARGGAAIGKVSKASVDYRAGSQRWRCADCSMFIKPSGCRSVQGHIASRALCNLYEPTKGHERIVNNKYDVVTGANSSKKPTGPIFIDRHIPEWSPKLRTKEGKRVRLWTYLSVHEDDEQKHMEAGDSYDQAHEKATKAERKKAEADGVDWKAYTEEVDNYLARVEHERVNRRPPVPLHVKPDAALKGEGHHHSSHKRPHRADGGEVGGSPKWSLFGPITQAPVLPIVPAQPSLVGAPPTSGAGIMAAVERLQSGPGNYVHVNDLKNATGAKDPDILSLADQGKLILGPYGGPSYEEPEGLVRDSQNRRYVGVAIPRKEPRRAGGGGVEDEPLGDLSPEFHTLLAAPPPLQIGVGPGFVGSSAPGAAPRPLEGDVYAPPSPNIAKAIARTNAWMQERAQREPQPVLQRNIEIMMRGGPLAEATAKHMLSTFQPHPSEALPSPSRVIDMGDE